MRLVGAILASGIGLACCSEADEVATRSSHQKSGIEIVEVVKTPPVSAPEYEWSMALRRSVATGAAQGDSRPMFFDPRSVLRLDDGTWVVADGGEPPLAIIPPGEETVSHSVSRLGQGPGELYGGYPVLWADSDSTFWVADRGNHRVSLYDTAGVLVEEIGLPVEAGATSLSLVPHTPTDRLFSQRYAWDPDEASSPTRSVVAIDFRAGTIQEVAPLTQPQDPPGTMVLWNHRALWTVLGNGHVVTGHDDSMSFTVWTDGGDRVRELRLDLSPRPVSEADRRRVLDALGRPASSVEVSEFFPFTDIYYPVSDSVFALRHTWVSHAQGDVVEDGYFSWRLISSGGYYMGAINFPRDFEAIWTDGDRLIGVQRDSRGVATIQEFDLDPPDAVRERVASAR